MICPDLIIHIEETDSTNRHLQRLCEEREPEEMTTVRADFQTSGRGQRGTLWESEPGKNLLFSFVLYPTFLNPRQHFFLSQLVSLAIKQELDTYAEGFSIKWPNDIYRDERKIAGILIENDFMDQSIRKSIVGVGININQDIFRGTAPNPVSLSQITGREVPLSPLLSGIMRRIASLYDRLKTGESETIAQAYTASVFRKEGMHRYKDADGDFEAVFVKVESDGRLFLQDSCGQLRNYLFKQVEYIL